VFHVLTYLAWIRCKIELNEHRWKSISSYWL